MDVSGQLEYRDQLVPLIPNREASNEIFLLIPDGENIRVHLSLSNEVGIQVGVIGPRNIDRAKALVAGCPVSMGGVIDFVSGLPKVKFVPNK